jgi:CubicO group peptidase (beta-lactamase class C family)
MSGLALSLCLLIAFSSSLDAQTATEGRNLDAFIRGQMTERRIPGMQLAVIRNGRIEKIGAYGYASLNFDVKVQPSTLFSVASISKSFTSVAIMMLVEAKKLHLDDSIGQYFPDLPESWRAIPLRRLLNHTSGLPDVAVDQYTTNTIADTANGALKLLRERPMDFTPGADSRYNQTNYMLLGMLVEKLSGQPFVEFCTKNMFEPFGVKTAAFGDSRAIIRNRATVYTPFRYGAGRPVQLDHYEVLNYEFPAMSYPFDGLNISITDFAAWMTALLDGKIIGQASLDEIWQPARLKDGSTPERPPTPSIWRSYGLGWVLKSDDSHPLAGGTGGIRAAFFVYPKDRLAVIVLTNAQGTRPESLADDIAHLYLR